MMKLLSIAIALISSDIAQGFSPANHKSLSLSHALPSKPPTHSQYTKRNLFNAQNGEESGVNEFLSNACGMFLSAFVVTSATFASSALPAQAEVSTTYSASPTSGVDTPKSALVIDSTGTSGDRIFKAELDTKSLLKTVFVNKDKLVESLKSVSGVIDSELHKKEWLEIQKELLDIEGDIAPQIKVQGPKNLKAALDELSKGKVSVVVNGELVTIDVEEVRGAQSGDEEITIHIKGTKLAGGSSATEQSTSGLKAIADFFGLEVREQKESKILSFLGEPSGINSYLPSGSSLFLTNGEAIGGGLATVIGSTYLVSYQYYLNSKREAEEQAKRNSEELAKKKAKLAAKKKKEEQKEKAIEKEPEKAEDPPAPIPETETENVIPEAQTEESVAEDQVDVSTDPVSKSEPEPEPEPEPESQLELEPESSEEEQENSSVDEEEVEESPKKERTLRKLKRKGKDSLRKLFGRE